MNQVLRIWNSLTTTQRITLLVVPALVCGLVLSLLHWKREGEFRILYTSLAPEDAASVTQKIREAGIEYRLDETGATVSVPSSKLAEARLALASGGLPRTGRIGFELFDKANLGASDFTEQVNYRRALEGELERTVSTLSEVENARIHITFARDSVFLDSRQPAKATAVLKLRRENRLSSPNVAAIASLIASSVDGLSPDAVAIVDSSGRLLNRPRTGDDAEAHSAEANLEYAHQVESELLTKINTSLEPLLGAGKFRAGVNVDCDFTASEENEESYDTAKSAILTSQTTEESTATGGASGTPGAAANLPRPPAKEAGASNGTTRRTENVSYQPGKSIRHTVSPKGAIRRISAAVLVDHATRWDGSGAKARKTLIAPSPEVLKAVREIVAGVTGFNEQRGDQISVEALPFDSTIAAEPPLPAKPLNTQPAPFDFRQPLILGAGAGSVLLIALVLLMMMRRSPGRTPSQAISQPHELHRPLADAVELPPIPEVPATLERQIVDNEAAQARNEAEIMGRIKLPINTRKTEVLVKHIREAVTKDPVNAANVLRTWVADADTRRTT